MDFGLAVFCSTFILMHSLFVFFVLFFFFFFGGGGGNFKKSFGKKSFLSATFNAVLVQMVTNWSTRVKKHFNT